MSMNRIRTLLQSGKAALGAIVTMPSPQVMQVMSRAGFDLLLIDTEHGPIDLASAHSMILATRHTGFQGGHTQNRGGRQKEGEAHVLLVTGHKK